jgi:hypothetical protein
MREIHTTNEWLKVSDMVAAAEVTLATIELAADALRSAPRLRACATGSVR